MLGSLYFNQIPYDYLISSAGGKITIDREVVFEYTFPHDIGVAILDKLYSYKDLTLYFHDGEGSYACFNHKAHVYEYDRYIQLLEEYPDIYRKANDFHIISFFHKNREMEECLECVDFIKENFKDQVDVSFSKRFIDVTPPGCDKGMGVETLLKILDLPFEQVLAIGDSYADVPMFEKADITCSFTYSKGDLNTTKVVDYLYEFIEEGELDGLAS